MEAGMSKINRKRRLFSFFFSDYTDYEELYFAGFIRKDSRG